MIKISKNNPSKQIVIRADTNKLINEAIEEFLRVNPDFENIHISYNFIVNRMAKYYLNKL